MNSGLRQAESVRYATGPTPTPLRRLSILLSRRPDPGSGKDAGEQRLDAWRPNVLDQKVLVTTWPTAPSFCGWPPLGVTVTSPADPVLTVIPAGKSRLLPVAGIPWYSTAPPAAVTRVQD